MNQDVEHTIQLGRLGRTVGLDGGLLFRVADDSGISLLQPGLIVMVDGHGQHELVEARRHSRGHVIHFRGIRRLERASPMVNAVVRVAASNLPEDYQVPVTISLVGLSVVLDGQELGRVREVAGAPGYEYAVMEPGGSLLPLHAPYVRVTAQGIELLDPPEGLL